MAYELIRDPLNIIICGVGGQGNILASELFASALVEKGYYATVGETYGASQRGGSVMSHIRVSHRRQYGPLIPLQQADMIIGFEPIETLRVAREYAASHTWVVMNTRPNYPIGVLNGRDIYPGIDDITSDLQQFTGGVYCLDASVLAIEAGDSQAANIVLLGGMAALEGIPLNAEDFRQALQSRLKGKSLDTNIRAFTAGYEAIVMKKADSV